MKYQLNFECYVSQQERAKLRESLGTFGTWFSSGWFKFSPEYQKQARELIRENRFIIVDQKL